MRGPANEDITAELALDLGVAATCLVVEGRIMATGQIPITRSLLKEQCEAAIMESRTDIKCPQPTPEKPVKPRAAIGCDTRVSGQFLDYALAAGLPSAGMDVTRVGVIPTPGVAYLIETQDIELGVVISVPHNPMQDNGIKFLVRGGYKLPDETENRIQAMLGRNWERPLGAGAGNVVANGAAVDIAYVNHLVNTVSVPLHGLRIVVDCANGAAFEIGLQALREAGAGVVVINALPDGCNINLKCGSTHPEQLQTMVVAAGADFGVAFDRDADRCLAVDGVGNPVDGDQITGMLALKMKEQEILTHDTLAVTVMSNLGLRLAMEAAGINVVATVAGDHYVLEEMRAHGYILGGEQSGYVINARFATTGDEILTALQTAATVAATHAPLSELVAKIQKLPQTLISVPGVDKMWVDDLQLQATVVEIESRLGGGGRVLLRPFGTEPLVRAMVKAPTQEQSDAEAAAIVQRVKDPSILQT